MNLTKAEVAVLIVCGLTLILLAFCGCATKAVYHVDANGDEVLTIRRPLLSTGEARFPNGAYISNQSGEMPEINALEIAPTINMPAALPIDALMQGKK